LLYVPLPNSIYIAPPLSDAEHDLNVVLLNSSFSIYNPPEVSSLNNAYIAPPFPFVLEHSSNIHLFLIVNFPAKLNSALIIAPFPFESVLSILENELSLIYISPAPLPTFIIQFPDILIVDTISLSIVRLPLFVYTNPLDIVVEPLVIIIMQLLISIFVNVLHPVII
jgi:hypothetical protein